jgi:hypothetical protein
VTDSDNCQVGKYEFGGNFMNVSPGEQLQISMQLKKQNNMSCIWYQKITSLKTRKSVDFSIDLGGIEFTIGEFLIELPKPNAIDKTLSTYLSVSSISLSVSKSGDSLFCSDVTYKAFNTTGSGKQLCKPQLSKDGKTCSIQSGWYDLYGGKNPAGDIKCSHGRLF